jgi:hypothetical protein
MPGILDQALDDGGPQRQSRGPIPSVRRRSARAAVVSLSLPAFLSDALHHGASLTLGGCCRG